MRVAGVQSEGRRGVVTVTAGDELDLRALGRSIWHRRRHIVGPAIVIALIAFVVVQVLTPKYRSEARILIEGRDNIYLRAEAEKTLERGVVDPEAVASQVQVVLSRDLARQVIKQLKLGERPEFDPILNGASIPKVLLGLFGLAKDPLRMTPEERVLEAYYERLNVVALERSRVISLTFESSDPEVAAKVANAIADTYLEMQQGARQEQARSAGQWLAVEIGNMRKKVADAEAKVEELRSKSNLYVGSNNAPLSTQQLSDMNTQLATARGQKADAETKARMIRDILSSGKPLESSEVGNSELIRHLTEQLATLRAQLAEQSATLLDGHPRIKELRAQIADLQGQIRSEGEKMVRAFENDSKIADARVQTLDATLSQLKRQAASNSGQDVELRALEREAKAERDLLESYLGKYREATARDNIDAAPAEARIISRATVSNTPAFPKKLPIVLVAMLAALVVSAGFVTTSELLGGTPLPRERDTFVREVREKPSLLDSLRGAIPALKKRVKPDIATPVAPVAAAPAAPFVVAPAAPSLASNSIDELVRGLRGAGDPGRRVTVVGTLRNVGTTYTAIALARALTKGARVVLVDLALGSPNISIISADPTAPGIADLVHGRASFGQIITRDRFSRLHLVAVGDTGPDGPAILASQRVATTFDALVRAYDHVIIDAGALPEAAVERIAHLAPRAVLIAADLTNPATAAARDRLLAAGFADVTVILGQPRTAVAA
ncbi:MAG: tyrosine-protein kinase Etk/Wzc [Alphaproteobacteria bacterium]|nr:tyrosine-protein kinase Etk/Wzc [Alphaproteobacteria bacterium]